MLWENRENKLLYMINFESFKIKLLKNIFSIGNCSSIAFLLIFTDISVYRVLLKMLWMVLNRIEFMALNAPKNVDLCCHRLSFDCIVLDCSFAFFSVHVVAMENIDKIKNTPSRISDGIQGESDQNQLQSLKYIWDDIIKAHKVSLVQIYLIWKMRKDANFSVKKNWKEQNNNQFAFESIQI